MTRATFATRWNLDAIEDAYRRAGVGGPLEGLARRLERLQAVFADVSYPNEMEALASVSKHLTPQSLLKELAKLRRPAQVLAFHLKPQFRDRVIEQLKRLGRPDVSVAEIGREYSFGDGRTEATRSSIPR